MIIATWNINSLRARKDRLLTWLADKRPDVVCLQETKIVDGEFPTAALLELGYQSVCVGQRTYNGVAVLSRTAIACVQRGLGDGIEDPQARFVDARVAGVRVICVYVPNGATLDSDKYVYKLAWLGRLRAYLAAKASPEEPLVICGDFNVAPSAKDVAHPEDWAESVLFHTSARAALAELCTWGLVDVLADKHPEGGVYSWWDYRMLGFPRNNGLRLDLILATRPLAGRCRAAWVDREARKGKQPSDHAPVLVDLDLP